jgi:SAM-dependent methyltransferase
MEKAFKPWGAAAGMYITPAQAADMNYLTKEGGFPPTPFDHSDNPYRNDLPHIKNVLEIGCGVGRNLPFFMENTKARYFGVDPNPSMIKHFWGMQDPVWKPRTYLTQEFDDTIKATKFDMVVSTFVLQHFTLRPPPHIMNANDITKEIMKYTTEDCLWFMLEHDHEDKGWQGQWFIAHNIDPDVYIEAWDPPSMNHRGPHNLIIFREHK